MTTIQATLSGQITSQTKSSSWRIGTRTTNALNTCIIFDLFDEAIANILCLGTYRHGTSPRSYHNIMKIGIDPKYGGTGGENAYYTTLGRSNPGSSMPADSGWNCKNRFFAFLPEAQAFTKFFGPLSYSRGACIGENTPDQYRLNRRRCERIATFQSYCTPTLKFRLGPNSPIKFTMDDTMPGTAGYTEQPIPASHIGLYGSLHEGVNTQWLGRIKQNPKQFCSGLLMLAGTVALVALAVLAAHASPFYVAVLAIYGIVKGTQILAQIVVPIRYQFKAKPLPA